MGIFVHIRILDGVRDIHALIYILRSFGRNACAGRGVRRRESPVRTVKVRSAAEISARRAKIFFARCARAEEFRSPRSQIEIYARGGRGGGFADERPRSMFDRVTV